MADKEHTSRRYLTEKEAAEILGAAERTLRDWRQKGHIDSKGTKPPRSYVRGRHIYYDEDELSEWIREGATDAGGAGVHIRKKRGKR